MTCHRSNEHGGPTGKESPRMTLLQGPTNRYIISAEWRDEIKYPLPENVYYDDAIPPPLMSLQAPFKSTFTPFDELLRAASSINPYTLRPVEDSDWARE
ncbi:hypothetical protein NLI96_g2556 [Meripilus lineatus]|uniref:Uncharacterized protein n=1 Tax=Meripilus lineatus TaxID=2056292 RepID=A0AAD5YGG4_9APHY|nr:hypothetical protein NLI96_g2556 [Physisporinus lineatus]